MSKAKKRGQQAEEEEEQEEVKPKGKGVNSGKKQAPQDESDDESTKKPLKKPDAKGKKGKKGDDDDEEPTAPAPTAKGKKGKGGKRDSDDEEDETHASASPNKKDKAKKGGGQLDNDEDKDGKTQAPTAAQLKKLKKREKQAAKDDEEPDEIISPKPPSAFNFANLQDEDEDEREVSSKSSKKGKKGKASSASAFELLGDDDVVEEVSVPVSPLESGKQSKKKKGTKVAFEMLEDEEPAAAGGESEPAPASAATETIPKEPAVKPKGKKGKQKMNDLDDLDAFLASLENDKSITAMPMSISTSVPVSAEVPASAAESAPNAESGAGATSSEPADVDSGAASASGEPKQPTAAMLKRQKEKERKAKKAAEEAAQSKANADSSVASEVPSAPAANKKESATIRLLRERQEFLRAQEAMELAEKERIKEEELAAEKKKIQDEKDEIKKQEELRKQRDAQREALKEQQRKEGPILSESQKIKIARLNADHLLKQPPSVGHKKRPVDKKKKKPVTKDADREKERTLKQIEETKALDEKCAQAKVASEEIVRHCETELERLKQELVTLGSSVPAVDALADDWDAEEIDEATLALEKEANCQKLQAAIGIAEKKLEDAKTNSANVDIQNKKESDALQSAHKSSLEEEPHESDEDDAAPELNESGSVVTKKKVDKRELRSPICCILGHVDTGKTSLLDKIRNSSVQEGEAGGITQQIGATYFPMETIEAQTRLLNNSLKKQLEMKVPGLLVIDTPGHASFTNLRSRGSNLCDIAILVVDIMHALEPQTIESINLLKMRKTPFIIALNKIDRCYKWKPIPNGYIKQSLEQQSRDTLQEFESRTQQAQNELSAQSLNTCLYYENKDFLKVVSIVPTSAVTGEGIPDLLLLLVQLTQSKMSEKLTFISSLQATVLEVKQIEGLGTTIDVVLVNGVIHRGSTIVVCGLNGPIVTTIRELLTPYPNKEIRVKGEYVHHESLKAAMGVKICAKDLENAVAGTPLLVFDKDSGQDIEDLKDEVMTDLQSILSKVDHSGTGVYVQASTLGALEALLSFLSESKIPVSGISLGTVYKKDIIKASAVREKKPEYAVILAFDVKVSADAEEWSLRENVTIFTADIIYHLFDQWKKYTDDIRARNRENAADIAVFPCILQVMPQYIYRTRDPLVFGVKVIEGVLRIGTPICVPDKERLALGRITTIQVDHKTRLEAKQNEEVCVCIEQAQGEQKVLYGRQFTHENLLYSTLTRNSIDLLKLNFKVC